MDPVFMYWNKINFIGNDDFKKFTVEFSNGDRFDGVLFQKENDYFITSLSTNIKIEKDLTKLEDYDKIKKISDELNDILNKGSDSLNEDIKLKIENVNDLEIVKTKRKLSTKTIEFLDKTIKKKKQILIYSPFKELKLFGLIFQKENDIFYKYNINLLADAKNNFFLEKKLFYNRDKIVQKIRKEFLYKNMIFMEKNGKLIVQPIDIVEYLALKIESVQGSALDIWKNYFKSQFQTLFSEIIFGGYVQKPEAKKPKIFRKGYNVDDNFPISISFSGQFLIKSRVNFYLTKELYDKKKSIFKNMPEIPKKIISTTELADLRKQLKDDNFSISEIYGFRNARYSTYRTLEPWGFEIPDFMVKIEVENKLKDKEKKIFEGSFYVLDNDYNQSKKTEKISKSNRIATIKNTFSEENQKFLEKEYTRLKKKPTK